MTRIHNIMLPADDSREFYFIKIYIIFTNNTPIFVSFNFKIIP